MKRHLTAKAQEAMAIAESAAISLKHDYIGAEHILYGLSKEGTGLAASVILEMGIGPDDIFHQLQILVKAGSSSVKPQLTSRSHKILELAFYESQRTNQQHIGTEHILAGIVREGQNTALQILVELGIDPQIFIQRVIEASATGQVSRSKTGTPMLDKFGKDLTELAAADKLDPVIGREDEMGQLMQVLIRRTKNNPCLVGDPGVGKSVLVEGLAIKIANGDVPESLKDKRLFSLDIGAMVAGTKFRGEFEQRLKQSISEVIKQKNIILFADEIHTLIGAGNAEGSLDAANMMKPSLARGELQVIGATTVDEYKKYIEKDAALERRFQKIILDEPSKSDTVKILKGIRNKYEEHHQLIIPDEAIETAVSYSDRYVNDRFLPDKAIDLIDEACSKVRLAEYRISPEMKTLLDELDEVKTQKQKAIDKMDFKKANEFIKKEKRLITKVEREQAKVSAPKNQIDTDDIADIITGWTKIPVKKLVKEEAERLMNMESLLHDRIIGQDDAVRALSKAIRRSRAGIHDPKRPMGSFLFLGPTGVGKSELCKALAEVVFGDEKALIRFDMSEYSEHVSSAKLIGATPGYVGYDEGGQLTNEVRRKPYSVILFDEVEKAHPDVFNTLLQVLDDGRLTDNHGRHVNFSNTIIIMTSNIGARGMMSNKRTTLGFSTEEETTETEYKSMKAKVDAAVKEFFRPEFINRIDGTIVFHPLNKDNINDILDLMINNLNKRLVTKEIHIEISDKTRDFLMEKGYNKEYGARPMRRAIQDYIENPLAEQLLQGNILSNRIIAKVDPDGGMVFLDANSGSLLQIEEKKELEPSV